MNPALIYKSAKTFMVALGEVFAFWKKSVKADSLISYTQTTRVEPIMMVDERVMFVPYLNDIAQTALSTFAGWYLQAAAISSTVNRIQVGKFLGHLNPERSVLESFNGAVDHAVAGTAMEAGYDFSYGLPDPTLRHALEDQFPGVYGSSAYNPDHKHGDGRDYAKERLYRNSPETNAKIDLANDIHKAAEFAKKAHGAATELKGDFHKGEHAIDGKGDPFKSEDSNIGFKSDLGKDLREPANMAVGRMYTVEISDGGHKASIPVMIRFLIRRVPASLLVHILGEGSSLRHTDAKERDFAYQLGDLRYWRDIVACKDLIAEHKKALLADSTGVYNAIAARRNKNRVATAMTAEPSVGTASNVAIVSRQSIRELEKVIGGKFDQFKVRQRVFSSTELIMVIVVDADDDHVTYYYRDIQIPTELTVSQIKTSAKGNGPDVADILKAFTLGQAPSL